MARAGYLLAWPFVLFLDPVYHLLPEGTHQDGPLRWAAMLCLAGPALPILHAAWILARSSLRRAPHSLHLGLCTVAALGMASTGLISVAVTPSRTALEHLGLATAAVWALLLPLAYASLARGLEQVLEDTPSRRRLGWAAMGISAGAWLLGAITNSLGGDPSGVFFLAALAAPVGSFVASNSLRKALSVSSEEHELRDAVDSLSHTGLTLVEDRMPLHVRLHLPASFPPGLGVASEGEPATPTGNPVLDAVLPLKIPAELDLSAVIRNPDTLLEVLHAHPNSILSTEGLTLQATLPELLALAERKGASLDQTLGALVNNTQRLHDALIQASESVQSSSSKASSNPKTSGQISARGPR